jgi:hypothetical protein
MGMLNNMYNILFVQRSPCIRNYKIATALKSYGIKVTLAYTKSSLEKMYGISSSSVYDNVTTFKTQQQLKDLSHNFDIVHCHNGPDTYTIWALEVTAPVIHDTHDLGSLTNSKKYIKEYEQIIHTTVHGRVFVSQTMLDIVNNLYNIPLDRSIVIYNYPVSIDIPNNRLTKLSDNSDITHLVYEGSISSAYHRRFGGLFNRLASEKLNIHIYSRNKFSVGNPYIIKHKPLNPKSLLLELSQYDWGLVPFVVNSRTKAHINTSMPNKLFEYLSVNVPVLVCPGVEMSSFVEKEKCGYVVDNLEDYTTKLSLSKPSISNKYIMEDQVPLLLKLYAKVME